MKKNAENRVAKNRYSYNSTYLGAVNEEPSVTAPNMALSMRELLTRHANNQELPYWQPLFEGEEDLDLPDFQFMDTLEKLQFAAEAREAIKNKYPKRGMNEREYVQHVLLEQKRASVQKEEQQRDSVEPKKAEQSSDS